MDKSELLAPEQSWIQRNLISPANEAIIADIYEPVKNVVNAAAEPLFQRKLLQDASIPAGQNTHARELCLKDQPVEYCTQLLARGAVGAATYTACGFATGGLLKTAAGKMALEGATARIVAAESTAMITGAAVHDALIDARNERERAANISSAVASFSTFEAFRGLSPKNAAGKTILHLSSGALGGAAGYATRSIVCGEQLDSKSLSQSSLDGAALNLLFPAARWYGSRILDQANVKMGRGIPIHRYLENSEAPANSPTFKDLVGQHPLVRIQPGEKETSIAYAKRTIHIADESARIDSTKNMQQEKLAGVIAHELSHLSRQSVKEAQLQEAAQHLKINVAEAKSLYLKVRISDEIAVREVEKQVLSELALSSREPNESSMMRPASKHLPISYLTRFEKDFEAFKHSEGKWRPEKDYALIPTEQREQLKYEKDGHKIVSTLYPELPTQQLSAIGKRLNEITKTSGESPFDLLYKMPRKAWEKSISWLTLTEYRKAKQLKNNSDFTDALEQHPSTKRWAEQLADTYKALDRGSIAAKKKFIDNVTPRIETYVIERTKLEQQKAAIDQTERQGFENAKALEKTKYKKRLDEIEIEFNEAEKKIVRNLRLAYPRETSELFEAKRISFREKASTLQLNQVVNQSRFSFSGYGQHKPTDSAPLHDSFSFVGLRDFYKLRHKFSNAYFDAPSLQHGYGSDNSLFRSILPGWVLTDKLSQAYHDSTLVDEHKIANTDSSKTEQNRMETLRSMPEYRAFYEIAGPLVELAEKYGTYAREKLQTCTELFPEVSKFRGLLFQKEKENKRPANMHTETASRHDLGRVERFHQEIHQLTRILSLPNPHNTKVTLDSKHTKNPRLENLLKAIQKQYELDLDPHLKKRDGKLRLAFSEHHQSVQKLETDFEVALLEKTRDINKKIDELEDENRQFINIEMGKTFKQLGRIKSQVVETQKSIIKGYCSSGNSVDWLPEHRLSTQIFDAALPMAVLFGNDANAWHEKNTFDKCFTSPRAHIPCLPLSADLRDPFVKAELLKMDDPAGLALAWNNASAEKKQQARILSPKKFVLTFQALERFKTVESLQFAQESCKWKFDDSDYADAERTYISSQSVPPAFPVDRVWTSGNYIGRFLPRSDVRALFMGNYTASCMRIGGANDDGVKWAQNSPDAGFFVIEHEKSKEILAASRVWNDSKNNATCVNSIQTKGEAGRLTIIMDIYKQVAKSLISEGLTARVTIGKSRIDFPASFGLEPVPRNQFVQTPKGIKGLTDCSESQWLLAEHSS